MECMFVLIIIAIVAYMLYSKQKEGFQNYNVAGNPVTQYIDYCQTACQSGRSWYIWWWSNWAKPGRDSAANCVLDCQNIIVDDPNRLDYFNPDSGVYASHGYVPTLSSP